MLSTIMAAVAIFMVSLLFSMFGKGGGELYLPIILSLLPISFYTAAGISLFLIFLQGMSMVFIYSEKHNLLDWQLAISLAFVVGISSFLGGFLSKEVDSVYLKIIFAIVLFFSAILLLFNKRTKLRFRHGVWHREIAGEKYEVSLPFIVAPVFIAAFVAGMLGISGGGLIVPIAVLLGGMPLRFAVAMNTFLVLASSSMGFLGHAVKGGIEWRFCLLFGIAIIVGSQIGSRLHIRLNERILRTGLAIILSFAAIWMILHTI